MKKISLLLIIVSLFVQNSFGQNAITGTGFTTGWPSACNANSPFTYFNASVGTTYTSGDLTPKGTGNQYWRLATDWGGTIKQMTNTIGSDVLVSSGTKYSLNTACTTNRALYVNVSSTNNRYIFKTLNAGSAPTGIWVFFELGGNSVTVTGVSQSPVTSAVYSGSAVKVTATLSGSFPTGQGAYLRYSTDNWATSSIVAMSGSGTSFTADIPSQATGITVKYYVFTSGSGLNIASSDADLYTINWNAGSVNGGSNYSYTVLAPVNPVGGTATANPISPYIGSTSTITLTGYVGTIQWYQSSDTTNVANWNAISGATYATYVTPTFTTDGVNVYYRATLTSNSTTANSNIVTVTPSPLSNPTNRSALVNTTTCTLSWNLDGASHPVMILRYDGLNPTITAPTPGTAYSVGNTLGAGTVVYTGSATNTTNTVTANTDYTYVFYSVNNNYYSTGGTATTAQASSSTDYFRSKTSGDFNTTSTWESSSDGLSWHDATAIPGAAAKGITIQAGNTVTVAKSTAFTAGKLTVNGTLKLLAGGAISPAPIYNTGSTLMYANGTAVRGTEWPMNTISGAGYPDNVTVTNNTTLTLNLNNIANATTVTQTLSMAGNLTIDDGSTLSLNIGTGVNSTLYGAIAFIVGGDITTNGTLSMTPTSHLAFRCNNYTNTSTGITTLASNAKGGDLWISGNFTNNGSSTTPSVKINGRALILDGSSNQTIGGSASYSVGTGATPFPIEYFIITKTGGTVTVNYDLYCSGQGTDNGKTNSGGGAITVNGNGTANHTILDLSGLNVKVSNTGLLSTIICQNNGFIRTNPATTISVNGAYDSWADVNSNIAFDQTTPGTTNKIGTLTLNRTGTSAVLNNSNDFIVTSKLQILEGKFNSIANIRLDSLAVGTLSSTKTTSALTVKDLIFTKTAGGLMNSAQFYKNGRNLTISGKVRTLVHFTATGKWNFVSFPYAATVTKMDGQTATIGTDYSLGWYDPAARATNISGWKSSTDVPMTAMKGYIINKKTPLEDLYFDSSVQGSDPMFNATISLPLTYTPSSTCDCNAGWNFISHPMSANGTPTLSDGVFAYGYNASQDAYKLYYYQYNPGYTYGAGTIKPFDAIFVKTPSATSVNVSYALSTPQGILRKAAAASNASEEIIQLNLIANNVPYETTLRVKADATVGADNLFDAPYSTPWNSTTPRIYTLISGNMYALNSFPENSTIPVGVRVPAAGDFTFTWDNQATAYTSILTDKTANISVDMSEVSVYNFSTATSGDINTRFEINVTPKVPSRVKVINNGSDYPISLKYRNILVQNLKTAAQVSVFDLSGKVIDTQKSVNNQVAFQLKDAGVYLLQISDFAGTTNVKVIVK